MPPLSAASAFFCAPNNKTAKSIAVKPIKILLFFITSPFCRHGKCKIDIIRYHYTWRKMRNKEKAVEKFKNFSTVFAQNDWFDSFQKMEEGVTFPKFWYIIKSWRNLIYDSLLRLGWWSSLLSRIQKRKSKRKMNKKKRQLQKRLWKRNSNKWFKCLSKKILQILYSFWCSFSIR